MYSIGNFTGDENFRREARALAEKLSALSGTENRSNRLISAALFSFADDSFDSPYNATMKYAQIATLPTQNQSVISFRQNFSAELALIRQHVQYKFDATLKDKPNIGGGHSV